MTKSLTVLAALAFAAPAFADRAVAMSDTELDRVAAGTGSLAPVTNTQLNINASPITLTQTAVAVNTQTQTAAQTGTQNASLASNGNGKCQGQGNAWGLAKQSQSLSQSQAGFAAAGNTAFINYHVVQVNTGG